MPTPSNAPAASTGGKEIQNPSLFAQLTERQAMPQLAQPISGYAKKNTLTVEKVGVISRIRLLVKATIESEEEENEVQVGMPFRLIKEIAIKANGVTGIIDCSGMTLEARRRRIYRNPVKAIQEETKKPGEKFAKKTVQHFNFVLEIPIAHDMLSLIGSLLAQNEETALTVNITWASENEVLVAGKAKPLEGEIFWDTTVFSIGSTVIGKEEVTVLPDLTAFHGLTEQETNIVAKGEQKVNLTRNSGQLLAYTATLINEVKTDVSPAEWTTFLLEYGGNKKPRVWTPASQLLELNSDEYDGPISIGGVHYLVVDNEVDNPTRDMIIPESLTELRSVIGVPAATVLKEAKAITTQETLYPAV
jgi:hypothetical protein